MFGRQDNHGTDSTTANDNTSSSPPEPAFANSPFSSNSDTSSNNSASPAMGAPVIESSNATPAVVSDLPSSSPNPVVGDASSKEDESSIVCKFSTPDTVQPKDTKDSSNDLLSLKQQALQQLTPLVGHLDQTPEERFRTTMMMIQAADNQSLIKDAYGAAQQISDEKMKAQALLDIVNEINYFTTKKDTDNA